MIEINENIDAELATAKSIDTQVELPANKKLLETVFKPSMGSQDTICIHQSRSITC